MAEITTLINRQDNNEIIASQIVAILAIEKANQMILADAAGEDPDLWDFSIFINRAKPWETMFDPDGTEQGDLKKGLVNCYFDSDTFDNPGSDNLRSQKTKGTFNLDCYGFKNSIQNSDGDITGYGDELSSYEVDRVTRLVRNIVMAEPYTYLKLGRDSVILDEADVPVQIVQRRYITRREKFMPAQQQQAMSNVIGERLTLSVDYQEFGPLSELTVLDTLIASCERSDTGEIYFNYEAT